MKKYYFVLIVLLAVHLLLLVNLKFTAWPEMLSYPYLRNNGYLLYKDMIHPYPPLLTMALSVIFKIFGYKLIVLKLFTWIIILSVDVLIFFIARVLTNNIKYSIFALIFYITVQPFLDGNMLWFDLAIVPPILLATLFILKKPLNKNLFIAGLFFGIAALIKQTTGIFLMVNGLWLMVKYKDFRKLFTFLIGPFFLFLILVLRLITEGALGGFINWTMVYPFAYWGKFPGYVQMALSRHQLFTLVLLLTPLVFFLFKLRNNIFKDKNLIILVSSILISVILVYPRFSFFHLQLSLAFLAILYGFLISRSNCKILPFAVYCALLFLFVSRPIFKTDWQKETRFWGKEDIGLAGVIKKETNSNDRIFLLGPHSGLYVLADRLPPKIWSDNFGWYLEIPGIQEQIINRWDTNKPEYIIIQDILPGNWHDLGTYRPKKIVDWINRNYFKKDEIQSGVWLWEEK